MVSIEIIGNSTIKKYQNYSIKLSSNLDLINIIIEKDNKLIEQINKEILGRKTVSNILKRKSKKNSNNIIEEDNNNIYIEN